MIRSSKEVIREFEKRGISIASWAREKGFNPDRVYQVLSARHRPLRGESHRIAVALGIKEGLTEKDLDF